MWVGGKGRGQERGRRWLASSFVFHFCFLFVFVKGAPESRNDPKISIDHEVWGDIFFNVSVEVVDEGKEINYYKNEKDKKTQAQATILIGGHKLQHTTESVSTNSFCTDGLPPLPSIRSVSAKIQCFMLHGMLFT